MHLTENLYATRKLNDACILMYLSRLKNINVTLHLTYFPHG